MSLIDVVDAVDCDVAVAADGDVAVVVEGDHYSLAFVSYFQL